MPLLYKCALLILWESDDEYKIYVLLRSWSRRVCPCVLLEDSFGIFFQIEHISPASIFCIPAPTPHHIPAISSFHTSLSPPFFILSVTQATDILLMWIPRVPFSRYLSLFIPLSSISTSLPTFKPQSLSLLTLISFRLLFLQPAHTALDTQTNTTTLIASMDKGTQELSSFYKDKMFLNSFFFLNFKTSDTLQSLNIFKLENILKFM